MARFFMRYGCVCVLASLFSVFLYVPVAFGQEGVPPDALTEEVPEDVFLEGEPIDIQLPPGIFFADDHDPHELVPILDAPRQEIQGSVEDSFYGIIHYDVYERAYLVEDFFPLGYSATVEYGYYPRLYETSRGWEPRVSRETGVFMQDGEEIASYVKLFDEAGNQTAYTKEGFSVVVPIMQMLAGLLGIQFRDDL